VIIEPTSSVFILRQDRELGWVTALVWHPRLECWLPAGGHVETDETAAQCGIREALEETGLEVTLVPGPAAPVPAGFPHRLLPAPWLVAEGRAAPDRHTSEPHVHEDHVYVATTASSLPAREPEHQVRWFTPDGIASAPGISEDSRILAAELLALAAPQPGPQFLWGPGHGHATAAGPQAGATADISPSRRGHDSAHLQRLIVIRGNSASGKSAVTTGIRDRYGRGLAIVSQDNLRRVVLREHDVPGGANIRLIDLTARHALSAGFHVIVEGILRADHYGQMLTALISDHADSAFAYYLDVPLEETLRRHATKTGTFKYGEAEMRRWYRSLDLLPGGIEQVISPDSALESTVTSMMIDAGLNPSDHTVSPSAVSFGHR
jgi:8-oxo-dGTP pyrophosphatase MutT (NUDIX family)/adenylylsulfate kinase-like enzyme